MVSWVQVDWGWGLGERRMFLAGPVIKSPVNVLSKSPVKHTHTTHTHTHSTTHTHTQHKQHTHNTYTHTETHTDTHTHTHTYTHTHTHTNVIKKRVKSMIGPRIATEKILCLIVLHHHFQ